MDYRNVGRTGLKVSSLCLGTMQWGWTADEKTAFTLMDTFVEQGGNFLDTADFYSRWLPGHTGGESEEIIGHWMKEWLLAQPVITAPIIGANSMQQLQQSLEALDITLTASQLAQLNDISRWQEV